MSGFQVGDLVECVDDDGGRLLLLEYGEIRRVGRVTTWLGQQMICLEGSEIEWRADRFRLRGAPDSLGALHRRLAEAFK